MTNALLGALVKLDSPLKKKYLTSFACCKTLHIDNEHNMRSMFYCQNRWCQTCAAIKMATMINRYKGTFEKLDDLHFVTLTMPTCNANDIKGRVTEMSKMWRKITDSARKQCTNFKGLRKTELIVSRGGGYHCHYHVIIQGESNANYLVDRWLSISKTSDKKAQKIEKVYSTENALLELFKYATKIVTKSKKVIPANQLDVIYQALYGRRLFQTFGGLTSVNEDEFEITPEIIKKAIGYYEWIGFDWYHITYAQALTEFHPSDLEVSLKNWHTQ